METKFCACCGNTKPISEFYVTKKTGLPHCHCKLCKRKYTSQWYQKNKDLVATQEKQKAIDDPLYYHNKYVKHKAMYQIATKKYREKNRDELNLAAKKWRDENKEYAAAQSKQYIQSHREEINQANRMNYANNPEPFLNRESRRRALIANAGNWTSEEWSWLFTILGKKCLACGRSCQELKSLGIPISKDHIIPLVALGLNIIENLQPLCKPCNSSKYNKTIDYRPQWLVDNFSALKAEAGFDPKPNIPAPTN